MAERRGPRIRFKGFEEDWEQRKLGEIFEESNERSSEMDILSVSVNNGIYPASESDRDVNPGASLENYKIVHKGDIVYNSMRMWQGAVGESVYDGIVSPAYVVVRAKQEVDSRYFGYLLKRPEMLYKYLCYSQGNSKDTQTLRYERFAEIEARISIEVTEQQMISRCIGKIDSLLSLHQRKLEKLKILKKAMLEKMFPKNGAKVPEIRFSGFTDDWEQRKLGEVFEEYSEKGHEELPPLTIAQGQGTIRRDESERTLQFDRESLSNYKVVHQNDFIVHLRSFEGGLEKANSLGIISPAYHTFHGVDTDSQFYYNYFRSRQFIHKELKPHVYGIRDGRSIDIEGMKTIRIPFTSLKEQSTIGSFILVLDSLLSLHQRKLEKLRQIKTSMLERMFV